MKANPKKTQHQKFIDKAKKLGCDDSEANFDANLAKVAVKHASDCAVHMAPAYEPGPCDCGAIKAQR